MLGNSPVVRQEIRGWEREIQTDPEDNEAEAEILDFITDPGNTRGRLTLLNQTIHTYWIMKCLIAKAMQSLPLVRFKTDPAKKEPSLQNLLEDMQNQLHHIKITQYQATDQISRLDDWVGRMEKLLQQFQQADMPGSTVKDPAPVSSSDG